MRTSTFVVTAIVMVLILGAGYRFYPAYPSPRSLCDLLMHREAQPGAVVIVSGRLYGGPGGDHLLIATCAGVSVPLAVHVPRFVAASPMSRSALRQIANERLDLVEKSADVTVVARLESHGMGCFASGPTFSALAVNFTTPVDTRPWRTLSGGYP